MVRFIPDPEGVASLAPQDTRVVRSRADLTLSGSAPGGGAFPGGVAPGTMLIPFGDQDGRISMEVKLALIFQGVLADIKRADAC